VLLVALLATAALCMAATASARNVPSGGTTQISGGAVGTGELANPEIREAEEVAGEPVVNRPRPGNKIVPSKPLDAPTVQSAGVAALNPELGLSFNGLNHRDQRTANGGNQFSVEPPDQANCVGNGQVLEVVNTVLRVFDTSGAPLSGVQDLNTFYGYAAQINRTTGDQGPFITDPVCLYEQQLNRFVLAVLTLDVEPSTGDFTGTNHLDVAISNTSSATGLWTRYSIPVQNDGTDGTVNDGCPVPDPDEITDATTNPRAEIGDYPHIGADANGIYLTTNGYCFFSSQYNGADIYAIGKAQLAGSPPASLNVAEIHNAAVEGSPGFTVWPAYSQPGQYSSERNGTEYFLSTLAGDGSETGNPTGTAKRIAIWALSNTSSLNSGSPTLTLDSKAMPSEAYVLPPKADQKAGPFPLGECINDTTAPTPFGPGCWNFLFVDEPAHNEVISHPDSNDTRMQQVWYVRGQLWGAADTGVNVGNELKAGIAWFMVEPKVNPNGKVNGNVKKQGYLALGDNNLTYPAIAVRPDGKGVIAFTVLGETFYPSAGYALVDANAKNAVGQVHVAAAGLGVEDGFTSYKAFVGDPPRTRWGDYGAAWVDGNDLWIASEYIGQTCTLAQYMATPFGSCGATRTALGNWYTRISKLTP
jgi:hypothetical protein